MKVYDHNYTYIYKIHVCIHIGDGSCGGETIPGGTGSTHDNSSAGRTFLLHRHLRTWHQPRLRHGQTFPEATLGEPLLPTHRPSLGRHPHCPHRRPCPPLPGEIRTFSTSRLIGQFLLLAALNHSGIIEK